MASDGGVTVGCIGMAQSAIRVGLSVAGHDLGAQASARSAEGGGCAAADPADAARDAVVVVVVNAVQTEAVLFGADSAVPAMRRGGEVVSCATMSPPDGRRLAAAAAAGAEYLDAPMSGGSARATAGQITVMASGTPAAFAGARPLLNAVAQTVHELGDKAGIGASLKIIDQLLAGIYIAACEAITASTGNAWMFRNRIPHVLEGDDAPRSARDVFTEDLGIVSDIGREAKFPTLIAASAPQMFLMTAAAGMGRDDDASVARLIARMTGLELPGARGGS